MGHATVTDDFSFRSRPGKLWERPFLHLSQHHLHRQIEEYRAPVKSRPQHPLQLWPWKSEWPERNSFLPRDKRRRRWKRRMWVRIISWPELGFWPCPIQSNRSVRLSWSINQFFKPVWLCTCQWRINWKNIFSTKVKLTWLCIGLYCFVGYCQARSPPLYQEKAK